MMVFIHGRWVDSPPAALLRFSREANFVVIGSQDACFLAKAEEIAELHRLLDCFLRGNLRQILSPNKPS